MVNVIIFMLSIFYYMLKKKEEEEKTFRRVYYSSEVNLTKSRQCDWLVYKVSKHDKYITNSPFFMLMTIIIN